MNLSLKTLQIGICASRVIRSSTDVVLSNQVCYNSKQTNKQKNSIIPSLHHYTEFRRVFLCTAVSPISPGWGEQTNGKFNIIDAVDTLSPLILTSILYINVFSDLSIRDALRKTPSWRHRRESWVFCVLVD